MKTDKEVSEKDYLDFVGHSVLRLDGRREEADGFRPRRRQSGAGPIPLPLPKTVLPGQDDGQEEGNAAYTGQCDHPAQIGCRAGTTIESKDTLSRAVPRPLAGEP